jgi:hypothetical protein
VSAPVPARFVWTDSDAGHVAVAVRVNDHVNDNAQIDVVGVVDARRCL